MSYSNGRCQGQEGKKSTMYVSLYWMIPGFKASVIFFAKLLTRSNLDVKAREGIGFIQQVEKSLNVVQRANEMRQQRGRNAIKSRNRGRGKLCTLSASHAIKWLPSFPKLSSQSRKASHYSSSSLLSTFKAVSSLCRLHLSVRGVCSAATQIHCHPKNKLCHLSLKETLQ